MSTIKCNILKRLCIQFLEELCSKIGGTDKKVRNDRLYGKVTENPIGEQNKKS